jgi:acetoin utilization deacetylase AcuC-like enzyme
MKVYYSDVFELPLPAGHRFPEPKYGRLRMRVTRLAASHGLELFEAPLAEIDELASVHTSQYLHKITTGDLSNLEQKRIGFPWSPAMVQRCRRSTGATIAAARAALNEGAAVHLAGGTHHAFPDAGQGFCVFNDVAVASRVLMSDGLIQRALVIDCDVHQGNGTAAIFAADDCVFTFSMHGDRNFPFRKCHSDLDVALADRTGDQVYNDRLNEALQSELPVADVDCVFYLAGADPYVGDRLGRLSLTKQGLADRDLAILQRCRQLGRPIVVVMAGGYARDLNDVVDIHARTVSIFADVGGRPWPS